MTMQLIKNMVNYKVNMISAEELMKYAKQFEFQISPDQAHNIAHYLKGKNYDIFDNGTRTKIIREIAKIAGPQTARDLNKLFIEFTK